MAVPRPHALQHLAAATRPVAAAGEQVLPVLPAMGSLLPWAGLRRGATVTVQGAGAASLAMALLAAVSTAGSWAAAVGLPSLGLVAAAQLGVDLQRLALVARPGRDWAAVVAALLDGLDIVVVQPPPQPRSGDLRRLVARARQRGAVLVAIGGWEGADVRLSVRGAWEGLGRGHGHVRRRRAEVSITGRGAAARPRLAQVWLPAADGAFAGGGRTTPRQTRAGPPAVVLRHAG